VGVRPRARRLLDRPRGARRIARPAPGGIAVRIRRERQLLGCRVLADRPRRDRHPPGRSRVWMMP
jgi:hypothetical protein